MPLPWLHFRPDSMTSHFDESTITGTLAMSGSEAMRLRKRVIAATPSIMPSSMQTSMTWAPFSTCCRATDRAASKSPAFINCANLGEPATFVRSPMLTKVAAGRAPGSRASVGPAPGGSSRRGAAKEPPAASAPRIITASRPLRRRDRSTFGGTRGASPRTASAIA